MTDSTHDWIASRGRLLATFSKPFRGMPQDKVYDTRDEAERAADAHKCKGKP